MSIPNCVAEMYREQEEKEEYLLEKSMRRREEYEKDNFLLTDAERSGLPILYFGGYDKCRNCSFRSHELTTWEEDDMSKIVCYNQQCNENSKAG